LNNETQAIEHRSQKNHKKDSIVGSTKLATSLLT